MANLGVKGVVVRKDCLSLHPWLVLAGKAWTFEIVHSLWNNSLSFGILLVRINSHLRTGIISGKELAAKLRMLVRFKVVHFGFADGVRRVPVYGLTPLGVSFLLRMQALDEVKKRG